MGVIKKKSVAKTSTGDFLSYLEKQCNAYFEPDRYKTGILPLDEVLGGYLESGSLIEISSESGVGKSTMLLHLSKNLAEQGLSTLYIDAEGSVKDSMIDGIGLKPYLSTKDNKDNLFTLVRMSGYTEVEELITNALTTGKFKLFIIDSLTALTGDIYLDPDENRMSTENRVGFDALMNSRLLKKLNALKTTYNCIFACVNQTRVNMTGFTTTYTSSGGQAVKFYPDIRLFLKLKGKIFDQRDLLIGDGVKTPIGAEVTIEAKKSRLGDGFIPYPMTIYFGKGISNLAAYTTLLPNLYNSNGDAVFEKKSTVSYILHLDSGDYSTTSGKNGLTALVAEHYDELTELCNKYVDDYFASLQESLSSSNYDERDDLTVEEADVKNYSVDDNLDLDLEESEEFDESE